MGLADRVEKKLGDRFRELVERVIGPAESRDLLEIHHAILDAVAGQIQPLPRGKRVFPFNSLAVRIAAPEGERRAVFELAFAEGRRLENDIRERLEGLGCPPAAGFQVEVTFGDVAGAKAFSIEYQRRLPATTTAARLVVLKGTAAEPAYALGKRRTNVGRLPEVLDDEHRVLRRNDVVFPEGDDPVNATVSRQHAHIEFDQEAGCFRLFDDSSSYGTRLLRENRSIPVPAGSVRGVKLAPGDEIYFGQAAVRFETGE